MSTPYFVPARGSTPPSLSGSILLLPQPSLASLAQLAADLLLHTTRTPWTLIGYLGLADYVPAVGGRDSLPGVEAPQGIAFGCEVYYLPTRSLVLVLPRSPVIRARREHYVRAMKQWIVDEGVKEVLIVAGIDAAGRGDEGLQSSNPLRHFLLPSSTPSYLSSLLPTVSAPLLTSPSTSLPLFPHGGLTRSLLRTFSSPASTTSSSTASPTIGALTIYTSEGDSSPSAYLLADALATVFALEAEVASEESVAIEKLQISQAEAGVPLEKEGVQWKTPRSWERGLMGVELEESAGREMFG